MGVLSTRRRFLASLAVGIPVSLTGPTTTSSGLAASPPLVRFTRESQERYLGTAEIRSIRTLSEGTTASQRATLTDGVLTHDAHVQTIDEFEPIHKTPTQTYINFKDSYRYNIAAYELDKLLNMGMIPVSVERKVRGTTAAFTWWVDDVLMSEKDRYLDEISPPDQDGWNRQIYVVRVFDELIYNADRNLGNLLITRDWRLWMIDHTRAFMPYKRLNKVDGLVRCDRKLLEAMRALTLETVERALGRYLDQSRWESILARRDLIVEHFEREVRDKGEVSVLYDLLPLDPTVEVPAAVRD